MAANEVHDWRMERSARGWIRWLNSVPRRSAASAGLSAAGLALLVLAQLQLQSQHFGTATGLLLTGGILLFAFCATAFGFPGLATGHMSTAAVSGGGRLAPLALAGATGVTAWLTTNHGVFTTGNVAAWVVATGAWCWAWWPDRNTRSPRNVRIWLGREAWWLGAVGVVLTISAFFRFHRLTATPLDPTSDHAEKLLDIHDIAGGTHPIFFVRNAGREPAQFYFTYLLTKLGLPLSYETLKIGTAFVGVLATLGVVLLATEVAGRLAGLVAGVMFGVGSWPVTVSRLGLRPIYAAAGAAFVLWLLLRYLRTGSRRDALLCGLLVGLWLYGYSSFRVVPLFVVCVLGVTAIRRRLLGRSGNAIAIAKDTAVLAMTAFIAALPFVHYTVQHPGAVLHRTFSRVGSAEVPLGGSADRAETFVRNTWRAAESFNWSGDAANLGGFWPFLDVVTGAAFLAGLVFVVSHAVIRSDARAGVLPLSLPVLLLPSTLNLAFPHENPSATRLAVATPVVCTVAALPLAFVARSLWVASRSNRLRQAVVATALGVVLAIAATQNYLRYFDDFNRLNRTAVVNTHDIVNAIRRTHVPLDHVYLLNIPNWLDGRNVGFAFGDFEWNLTHDLGPGTPLPTGRRQLAFVLTPGDARLRQVERIFPGGTYTLVRSAVPGRDFAVYITRGSEGGRTTEG